MFCFYEKTTSSNLGLERRMGYDRKTSNGFFGKSNGKSGRNIKNPFKPKKDNTNWFKFRKFQAPLKNMQGIHTGETYHALFRGLKVGEKIDIFKRISNNRLSYGYRAKYKSKDITKYINVNIGVSEEFMNKEANRIADIIIEMMEDIRNKYI